MFHTYTSMIGSGLTPLGAIGYTIVAILIWPFMKLGEWSVREERGFGKFRERTFEELKAERDVHNVVKLKD